MGDIVKIYSKIDPHLFDGEKVLVDVDNYDFANDKRLLIPFADIDGKIGFRNRSGEIVCQPAFDSISGCCEDEEDVLIVGQLHPVGFDRANDQVAFYEHLKLGVIDSTGKIILQPEYNRVYTNKMCSCFVICIGTKYGAVERDGKEIIPLGQLERNACLKKALGRIYWGVDENGNHMSTFIKSGHFIISNDGSTLLECEDSISGIVTLPQGIKNIAAYAFAWCENIESITLPTSLRFIEEGTFEGCTSIKSIHIPAGVKYIGSLAFEGCKRLSDIKLSNSIEHIGSRAFGCCHSLQSITIPASVITLGDGVFDGCTRLKELIFEGRLQKIGDVTYWMEPGNYNAVVGEFLYGYFELNDGYREYGYDIEDTEESFEYQLEEICERWNELKIFVPFGEINTYKALFNCNHIKEIFEKEKDDNSSDDYEEALINPPKSGDALTLVDFSKSPAEIAATIEKHADNLVVLKGNRESDGAPFYALVDKENYASNGFVMPKYYEEGTSYAHQINKLSSCSFSDIRNISVRFIQKLSDEEKDKLFEEINHGMDVLSTNEHLHAYIYCFGLMHEAKLNKAFLEIPKRFFKPSEIEIVDYACGQGLASLCFANFLEESGHGTRIKKITLIEPSTVALSRAALICHKVCPEALIETIASEFDDLDDDQISMTEVPKVHLLSNILDMTCYDLNHFAKVINQVKKKGDLFVCVDPWYHDRKLDGRQRKLMRLLNGKEIYHNVFNKYQLQEDKTWTAYITIFRV